MFTKNINRMLTDLVDIIKNVSLRHKGVKTFKYQGKTYNNAQNNYKPFQVYLDSVSYHNLNITTNIFTVEFNMYILSQPTKDDDGVLNVQNSAYTIATDIVAYIDNADEYKGVVSMHDYGLMTLDHYTDDDSSGVRLSLTLETPSPVNLCNLSDNFNDDPYEEDTDDDINSVSGYTRTDPIISEVKVITLPKGCSKKRK